MEWFAMSIMGDAMIGHSKWTGQAMPRREDQRLLTGAGRFVADLAPEGCLALEVLRSPYAGGTFSLDISDAQDAPGVRLVLTGDDLALLGAAGVNPLIEGVDVHPMQPMALGRVSAVGQPVVAVVADTVAQARDALDLIVLDVEEDDIGTTPVVRHRFGGDGRSAPASLTVAARVDHALVAPFALEPRATLAIWEDGLTAHLSTQTPQRCRDDLAIMLGLPRKAVRVVAPDVGGAFGGKASLMPEDVICAYAARALGAAVLWVATRSDEFQAATQGRGARTSGTLTLDDTGRVHGMTAQMAFPLGHWMPYSSLAPIRNAGRILPGPYAVAQVAADISADLTPRAAVNIYRGAGRPEAAMLIERLMDKGAQAAGMDPLAFRRLNIMGPGDLPAANGVCSGDFAGLLDRLETASGYAALRAAQSARRAAGEVCGLGIALYVEPCGQGWETAEARLMADGTVVLATGSSAQGQGRETAFAQLVADALQIAPDHVQVVAGDTQQVPDGIGALASRSTAIGGSAAVLAARALGTLARVAAAKAQATTPDHVIMAAGGFWADGVLLTWADLAARLGTSGAVLVAPVRYDAPAEAWASGAVLAEVTLDPETGVVAVDCLTWVDDAGHVVNPMLVEGQMIGGAAQGIGAALMERIVYQEGQLVTGSLMDYAVPRASDMPPLRIVKHATPSPANILGVKGVGEAGCIGIPAALLNAVMDALPANTPDLSLPLTSEQVWRALSGMDI
ncbi:MAG: xanthine dehydrogenase family protein molybdopterin-binding subunit [Gemmobacter sp.]|nr:xanthine dehydrogenase family protein molybdopterin-binding subunit [Gemmobacter sp.]